MIDAVLSYHLNPQTCGVTKFNIRLAQALNIPHSALSQHDFRFRHPLVSIKYSETDGVGICDRYDLLLHDRSLLKNAPLYRCAESIFYADELGCPSTVDGDPTRGAYRVLTFGMAHKRLLPHYEALKVQLDAEHDDYTVEMSTAIHEGTPWDEGHQKSVADMRAIFGPRLRVLGFLGDDALAKELAEVDAVAVYFEPAFRANNTSAWAAIDAGKTLYTNRDEHSPKEGAPSPSWASLVTLLQGVPCAK